MAYNRWHRRISQPSNLVAAIFGSSSQHRRSRASDCFSSSPYRPPGPPASALSLAMALRQRAPWPTPAAVLLCLLLALVLWSTASKSRKMILASVMSLVAFSALMSRLHYFEWMFHPQTATIRIRLRQQGMPRNRKPSRPLAITVVSPRERRLRWTHDRPPDLFCKDGPERFNLPSQNRLHWLTGVSGNPK